MKLNRVAAYLSQSDIAASLIYCRLLMSLGRSRSVQARLIELFERLNFVVSATSDADARRRARALGDAATWLADSFLAQSKRDDGIAFFKRLLERNPGSDVLYRGLCRLIFPGDHYLQILKELHRRLKPKFYMEIGVAKGASLSCVMASTDAVGVDPNPRIARKIGRNITVFPETSDAFFAAYERRPQFAGRKINFAFIDGLHHFEQALRDFINVEMRAADSGLIALHDCVPFDATNSARNSGAAYWVGDVWKTLAALMDHRPELDVTVIGAPPSGLVLVRGLAPTSRVLEQQFGSIVNRYFTLGFADWERDYRPRIRIIPSHANDVEKVLSGVN
jgi:hypothetical protein